MSIGADLVKAASVAVLANVSKDAKAMLSTANSRWNLCRGVRLDYRVNLACLINIDPMEFCLTDSLAHLLNVEKSLNALLDSVDSFLKGATFNLWIVDSFYAVIEAMLVTVETLVDVPKLALISAQAALGQAALGGASSMASAMNVLGTSQLASAVQGDVSGRIRIETDALHSIEVTAAVLAAASLLAGHVLMDCKNILLRFVRARRKAQTVKLSQTRTGRQAIGLSRIARNVFNAPLMGCVSITPTKALSIIKAARSSSPTAALRATSQRGSLLGSSSFSGVASIPKSTPLGLTAALKSASMPSSARTMMGSTLPTMPTMPSLPTKAVINNTVTKLTRSMETLRIPGLDL